MTEKKEPKTNKTNLEYFLRGVIDIYRLPTLERIQNDLGLDAFYLDPCSCDKDSEIYYSLGVGFSAIVNTLSVCSVFFS
jgi:hypothetical protein